MAWRAPPASHFCDLIRIERTSQVSDGMGGFQDSWTVIATSIAASIQDKRGGEKVQSDRLSSISAVDIVLRRTGEWEVQTDDRLIDMRSGEIFSVKWVGDLDQERRHTAIAATRGEVHQK